MRTTALAHVPMMIVLAVLLAAAAAAPVSAGGRAPATGQILEIRSYNLKPGTRDRFHALFLAEALPMLWRWHVDVVSYGPSPHDHNSWYLMRAYRSLEDRQRSDDAFYGSDEWKRGPRESILAAIENYTTIVLSVDEGLLRGLRHAGAPGPDDDAAKIVAGLDREYQAAVKRNDAETMSRILADDFVLVTGRGQAFTKSDLLKQARDKSTVYEQQDELEQKVRVWGDTAVVTALLWLKGTTDGKPFDRKLWFSDTYVKTPAGWKYVFGQASLALPAEVK